MSARKLLDVWTVAHLYLADASSTLDPNLSCSLLGDIRSRNWKRILERLGDISISSLKSIDEVVAISQLTALFKKNADFSDPVSCQEEARKSFVRAEKICAITNKRLDYYCLDHPERMPEQLSYLTGRMRDYLSRTLGPASDFIGRIPDLVSVTSGASADHPRSRSLPYMKVRKVVRATAGALPFVRALSLFHIGTEPRYSVVSHNRVVTVPKTSLTDRTIACEPVGNLPFQLAVDRFIKQKLIKIGIDLSDQRRNQRLAKQGSIDDSLATIDLSMASDTMALNAVLAFFPEDWSQLLMRLRSPMYRGIFGNGIYQKFSSMGNGCTFTLETILFASMCFAVGSKDYSVYGDDIIIESHHYDELLRLLAFVGFIPNKSKSFSAGPFRESCGADYYKGVDVRPFFWRKSPTSPPELAHYINGLAEVGIPGGRLWRYLKSTTLNERVLRVPFNESSTSGVHLCPRAARSLGILRTRGWLEMFRGYVVYERTIRVDGIRPYLLWHFYAYGKRQRDLTSGLTLPVVSSEVSSQRTSVRKRKVIWRMPNYRAVHLDLWTNYLLED